MNGEDTFRGASRPVCECSSAGPSWARSAAFHVDVQDTECAAWKQLLDLIQEAASDGRKEFDPGRDMAPGDWAQIVTLPPTIGKLGSVVHLKLFGSHLVRIPPEIGQMTSLEEFSPYTSPRLHWFPYEITRCRNLRDSTVSTRLLYGNFKERLPFPSLQPTGAAGTPGGFDSRSQKLEPTRQCSVCVRPFDDVGLHRVWISLRVATDVLPLLVNACSEDCIRALPAPAEGYVQKPHRGGRDVQQPAPLGSEE